MENALGIEKNVIQQIEIGIEVSNQEIIVQGELLIPYLFITSERSELSSY